MGNISDMRLIFIFHFTPLIAWSREEIGWAICLLSHSQGSLILYPLFSLQLQRGKYGTVLTKPQVCRGSNTYNLSLHKRVEITRLA